MLELLLAIIARTTPTSSAGTTEPAPFTSTIVPIETAESDTMPSAGFGIAVGVLPQRDPSKERRIVIANPHRPVDARDPKGCVYVFSEGWRLPSPVLSTTDESTRFGTCLDVGDVSLAVGVSAREGSKGTASVQLFRSDDLKLERRLEIGVDERVHAVHFVPDLDADGRQDLLVELPVRVAARTKYETQAWDMRVLALSTGSGQVLRDVRSTPGHEIRPGALFVPVVPGTTGNWIAGIDLVHRSDEGIDLLTESLLIPRDGELVVRPAASAEERGWHEVLGAITVPGSTESKLALLLRMRSGSGHVMRWIDLFPKDPAHAVLQEAKLDTVRDDLRVVTLTVDLNRDGRSDLLLAGQLVVGMDDWYTMEACDGTTGARLWAWKENLLELASGPIVPAGDIDADGVTDLLVGCPGCRGHMPGLALLVSGATGKRIASFREP